METLEKIGFFNSQPIEMFFPLTHTRDIKDLVVGAFTAEQRIVLLYQELNITETGYYIQFSSSILVSKPILTEILTYMGSCAWFTENGELIAYKYQQPGCDYSILPRKIILQVEILAQYLHIADILSIQSTVLAYDIFNYLAEQKSIRENVVINTQTGPVYIHPSADIGAFCYIEGPTYIGAGAKIRSNTQIKSSYIAPGCRIGSEIDSSIFLEFSNKGHDGYVGNSYIGAFVNFGAMATTSNLKNNYRPIRLEYMNNILQTQSIKLGSIIGDFTTLGIGVLLNTGTTIGPGSNILSTGKIIEKNISPFTWISSDSGEFYQWEKFLENIQYIMSRRDLKLEKKLEKKLEQLYKNTRG